MYKNLNITSLGVSGRQSEIIELALTYGFFGMDLDMRDFCKRVELRSLDQARRYFDSAKERTNFRIGGFRLPIDWQADEAAFPAELEKIAAIGPIAKAIEATRCFVDILPWSDDRTYDENFEWHRTRLKKVADALQPHGTKLGIGFDAAESSRSDKQYQFLHRAEDVLVLIKMIGSANVGIALDSWHWRVGGGTVEKLRELDADQITQVRLADAPDVPLESLLPDQRLLPGAGVGDGVALLDALNRMRFDGPISPAPHPAQFSGMTREAIVQRTSEEFDRQWEAAGLVKPTSSIAPTDTSGALAEATTVA